MKFVENWKNMALRFACFAAPLILVICLFIPVRNRQIDLGILLMLALSVGGWLVKTWQRPVARTALLLLILTPFVLLGLPGRASHGPDELTWAYTSALQRYLGSRYWWGGETRLGIDCSGLIRAGMIDACVIEGLKSFDGGLLRDAASLWWHDETAEALGAGYRNLTMPVLEAKSLNELDYSKLRPGDLALAGGGCHILAYLGNNRWIQADPNAGEVIIDKAPSSNRWFIGQVRIVRWMMLAEANCAVAGEYPVAPHPQGG